MKKLIATIMAGILLSFPALGADEGVVTRFGKWLDGKTNGGQCECPACPTIQAGVVCPSTPYDEIQRPPFEIESQLDFFATPSGGSAQFHAENFTFRFKHNFSPVLNAYIAYGVSTVNKTEYKSSLYDATWQFQTFTGGVGWYVHPIIEIFGGAGKTMAKNADGSEPLGVTVEYGIKAHWAINQLGYKFIFGLVTRESPLADEGTDIRRSQADASGNFIFAGVALPVGL
jgi:hypothetical protein